MMMVVGWDERENVTHSDGQEERMKRTKQKSSEWKHQS